MSERSQKQGAKIEDERPELDPTAERPEPEPRAPAEAESAVVSVSDAADAPVATEGDEYVSPVMPADEPSTAQPADALPEVPTGHVLVVYRGTADVVVHGEHRFRSGQPVAVPSEVAEDLLTLPNESFEQIEAEAKE